MYVQDLINELQKLPPLEEIVIKSSQSDYVEDIRKIEKKKINGFVDDDLNEWVIFGAIQVGKI